ncbi:hypothetical protein GCM10023194_48760 [Planotetraspora phitsanulokensis]|uniref:Uncharacterized protein n=1 Tax=Planotetraspora phitsanulokensis TaxID=575192 RepID=A0A8J3UP14_9ACTN|nr:hypothetical protein [Planotetraspora phitsanulokensis]GII42135.1 hypothetical protein Pph01_71380 [Planotetraspora phitsanulokensis]
MRHFFGLLLGVFMTAAVLLGAGWASQEVIRGAAQNLDPSRDWRILTAIGVMALVGLLLAVVLVTRVSPLAAFVPSLVLLAWTVVYILDVSRATGLAPTGPSVQVEVAEAGRGMLTLLSTGILGMLGVALFVPVLMPSRWAGPVRDDEEEYEETVGY